MRSNNSLPPAIVLCGLLSLLGAAQPAHLQEKCMNNVTDCADQTPTGSPTCNNFWQQTQEKAWCTDPENPGDCVVCDGPPIVNANICAAVMVDYTRLQHCALLENPLTPCGNQKNGNCIWGVPPGMLVAHCICSETGPQGGECNFQNCDSTVIDHQ